MNLIKSTSTFSLFVILSRILGYIRDFFIAIYLGSGPIADAFFVAFRIPNTFRRLFAEGTFNAAFVPSYTSELLSRKKRAQKFANSVFNLLVLTLLSLTIIIEIFMPSFIRLIAPGFSDSGEIFIDDTNLNNIKNSWQKKIGYVPQETYLFDDTIKNNIAFGIKDNLIDKNKIYEIINETGLNEIINSLPDKIDSFVGDNGAKLSGGQKQRLGLARALYIFPEILILDEATSALDFETESKILSLLNKYKNRITIIIISHRETILPYCDKILDLNKI